VLNYNGLSFMIVLGMQPDAIIKELRALEDLFEEGRQRVYSIRILLERFHAPAPSGASPERNRAADKMIKVLSKRKSQFYQSRQQSK
jgi:hypothetical protein